jgi:hypothetical protein
MRRARSLKLCDGMASFTCLGLALRTCYNKRTSMSSEDMRPYARYSQTCLTLSSTKSKLPYDWRCQYVLVWSQLWELWPDITSCRNVAVWKLRSCFCGTPSLTRGRVCSLQCNHSIVRVALRMITDAPWYVPNAVLRRDYTFHRSRGNSNA